jgi:hypothetical protein
MWRVYPFVTESDLTNGTTHYRCAGIDISKRDAKVCVRVQEPTRAKATPTVTTWGSVTSQILALREHLITQKVILVVMEVTGVRVHPDMSFRVRADV